MTNTTNSNESNKKLESNIEKIAVPKKPVKPPKVEDKPFNEFIIKDLIPGLKKSILDFFIRIL